jgi:hypothetical protein
MEEVPHIHHNYTEEGMEEVQTQGYLHMEEDMEDTRHVHSFLVGTAAVRQAHSHLEHTLARLHHHTVGHTHRAEEEQQQMPERLSLRQTRRLHRVREILSLKAQSMSQTHSLRVFRDRTLGSSHQQQPQIEVLSDCTTHVGLFSVSG